VYPFQIYERGPKFTNFASQLPTCPLGAISLSVRWDMSTSSRIPNLKSLALPVPNLGRIQKFINSAHGPHHAPFWGYFLIHKMGLAKIYPCTKFEVSNFARYKCIEFVIIHIANLSHGDGRGTFWLHRLSACAAAARTLVFIARISTLTRDIVCPSVCPSVRDTLVLYENGLTHRYSFFTTR